MGENRTCLKPSDNIVNVVLQICLIFSSFTLLLVGVINTLTVISGGCGNLSEQKALNRGLFAFIPAVHFIYPGP